MPKIEISGSPEKLVRILALWWILNHEEEESDHLTEAMAADAVFVIGRIFHMWYGTKGHVNLNGSPLSDEAQLIIRHLVPAMEAVVKHKHSED